MARRFCMLSVGAGALDGSSHILIFFVIASRPAAWQSARPRNDILNFKAAPTSAPGAGVIVVRSVAQEVIYAQGACQSAGGPLCV